MDKIVKESIKKTIKLQSELVTMDYIPLDEMLTKTIPGRKIARALISGRNFQTPEKFDADVNYGIVDLISLPNDTEAIHIYVRNKNDEKKITDWMGKMGWFVGAYINFPPKGFIGIQYEHKKDKDLTDFVFSKKYIYHFTKKSVAMKIKKYGFVPKMRQWKLFNGNGTDYTKKLYKNTNDHLNYGRIYFFLENNQNFHAKEYFSKKDIDSNNDDDYVMVVVDTKKLPKDVKFYRDIKQNGAVYTTDNIPPTAIYDIIQL